MIAFYYQTKIPIGFWCRHGLNPRYLIQPSETLPIELTGTHDENAKCHIFLPSCFIFYTYLVPKCTHYSYI